MFVFCGSWSAVSMVKIAHWAYYSSASGVSWKSQLSSLLTFLLFGFCLQNNIWRLELECNGHSCGCIFFSSCQLCSKSSFLHLVQWSSKRKRQRVEVRPSCWFTIPLVFKDWQQVTSWHLNSLPECSCAKTSHRFIISYFLLSKTSTSWIICCNQLGKKIPQALQMVADLLGIFFTVQCYLAVIEIKCSFFRHSFLSSIFQLSFFLSGFGLNYLFINLR